MSILLLLIVYFLIIFYNKKYRGTIFDAFFFIMTPYVAIISINNFIMRFFGFDSVSNSTILLHVIALIVFYAGTNLGDWLCRKQPLQTYIHKKKYPAHSVWKNNPSLLSEFFRPVPIQEVSIKKVKYITLGSQIIIALDIIIRLIRYGAENFIMGEEYGQQSLPAHLALLIVPLTILLLENFYKTKDKFSLVLVCCSILFMFLTFIKYNVISAILGIFMYFAIKYPKLIVKFGLIVLAAVFGAFIFTYVVSFIVFDTKVESSFYLEHLWAYLAGGTLNIPTAQEYLGESVNDFSIFSWIFQMITSFPSMITNRLFNFTFSGYNFKSMLPEFSLGVNESTSNVVSLLGAAYIQSNIFLFAIFLLFWGVVVQWVYANATKGRTVGAQLAGSIFLAFNMLSFFACFFELSGPWETIIWGLIVGYFIRDNKKRAGCPA